MALGDTTGMPLADAIRVADRFLYYEKGDISNVVSKGTFLMSLDSVACLSLTGHHGGRNILQFLLDLM
jgi:hypothetical protein